MTLYINGRFLTQPVSGVQRYARELTRALDARMSQSPALREQIGPVEVLVPHEVEFPWWQVLRARVVPGGRGHLWDQGALYQASRDGTLLSLCNSGPLRHRSQVLCLHDANLYEIPQAFDRRYRLVHRFLRPALAERAAALITVSRFSARALSRCLNVPEIMFQIVPNSAEHVLRWPKDPDVPFRYGLVPGGYLLAVGNQSPNKNIATLIAAHRYAGPEVPPLAVVGGSAPGVALQEAHRTDRVHMLGRVPDADLRGLYTGAAGFVFPSLHEGFGIPPLEAMQLGVPVLCARSGAMPEVLGSAPLWFDPCDEADIALSLRAFSWMSDAERADISARGRACANGFSWKQSADMLIGILRSVENRHRVAA